MTDIALLHSKNWSSSVIQNRIWWTTGCGGKPDLVELGFPPFLAPPSLFFREMAGQNWGTWPSTAPFCPNFVAIILFIEM
jgi:hypothetical protein